jgi:hypothetical protein
LWLFFIIQTFGAADLTACFLDEEADPGRENMTTAFGKLSLVLSCEAIRESTVLRSSDWAIWKDPILEGTILDNRKLHCLMSAQVDLIGAEFCEL